jgi:hypothetical protein
MKLINLNSVGSVIDADSGMIFPQNVDGSPDLECGSYIYDEPEDSEWNETLSREDAAVVKFVSAIQSAKDLSQCPF